MKPVTVVFTQDKLTKNGKPRFTPPENAGIAGSLYLSQAEAKTSTIKVTIEDNK